MAFAEFLKKRMFLLVLISSLMFFPWATTETETFGINKTVAWEWDISIWLPFIKFLSIILFITVYGLLIAFKKETNLILSAMHLIVILVLVVLNRFYPIQVKEMFFLYVLAILVFLINVIWAIRNKRSTRL